MYTQYIYIYIYMYTYIYIHTYGRTGGARGDACGLRVSRLKYESAASLQSLCFCSSPLR